MTPLFLTTDELRDLTGRTRRDAQASALRYMGIEHKIRPDGSVAVLRAHVEKLMGGENTASAPKDKEPNWAML